MKVWITKYALSKGITTAEVNDEWKSTISGCVHVPAHGEGRNRVYAQTFYGHDWHRTEAAALARAEEMRIAKIASLEKQIAKLRKMKFEVS